MEVEELPPLPTINQKDISNYSILLNTRKGFSKKDLVDPFLNLLKARKSQLFKGYFKSNTKGKVTNFIMSKSEMKQKGQSTPQVSSVQSPEIHGSTSKGYQDMIEKQIAINKKPSIDSSKSLSDSEPISGEHNWDQFDYDYRKEGKTEKRRSPVTLPTIMKAMQQ